MPSKVTISEPSRSDACAASKDKEQKFRESWKVPARYEVRALLGQGAYGSVAAAKDQVGKRKVAIKQTKHLFDDLIDAKRILREVAILGRLDHKHIVKLHDVTVPADVRRFDELYIVLEMCDSDLKKLLRADVKLSHKHITSLLYNLLVGLNYLHSAGIWHRDLKPANCLVNEDCTVKICDFGLARALGCTVEKLEGDDDASGGKRCLTGHVVTRWYRAPELILLQEDYTESIDIWSVACIYAELLGMLEEAKMKVNERAPLFPGHTCFPLSPHPHDAQKDNPNYYTKGNRDQLVKIFDLIGTPSAEEIRRLDGEDAQEYVCGFRKREGSGVKKQFDHLDTQGSDLLDQMLKFDPRQRIAVRTALDHPLFERVRARDLETTASEAISLDFEHEVSLDEKSMRKLFLQEVRRFHPGEVPELD